MIDFLQPFYLSSDFSSEQRQINSGIEFSLNYCEICADLSSNMVQLSFSQARIIWMPQRYLTPKYY